jgi:hypothetical protein
MLEHEHKVEKNRHYERMRSIKKSIDNDIPTTLLTTFDPARAKEQVNKSKPFHYSWLC